MGFADTGRVVITRQRVPQSKTSALPPDGTPDSVTAMVSSDKRATMAFVAPFALFLLGIAAVQAVKSLAGEDAGPFLRHPEYWIYPLQTILCAGCLAWFWKEYDFGGRRGIGFGILTGLVALAVWISPQWLFGQPARTEGFDPTVFEETAGLYWMTVLARFARLVIVVPLLEEIFWRGFLMRYLIHEKWRTVPFGAYTHLSFFAVAILFMFEHSMADWPAAIVTGILFNLVAIRTKSLAACVVAHAVTNLGLGFYIMATRQWGFW